VVNIRENFQGEVFVETCDLAGSLNSYA